MTRSKDEKQIVGEQGKKQWLQPDTFRQIVDLSDKYTRYEALASKTEEKLRQCVKEHMSQGDLWKNPDAIMEVIDYLPQCYLRFNLFETYHDVIKKQEEQKESKKNKQKGAAKRRGMDR